MSEVTAATVTIALTADEVGRLHELARKGYDNVVANVVIGKVLAELPLPIPDPPEGCTRALDAHGCEWTRYPSGDLWTNVGTPNFALRWRQLVREQGPVTPLIPGDPITAGDEQ